MSDDLQHVSLSEPRRKMLYVLWGLYLGSWLTGGVTLIIGIALAYIKRDDAATEIERSHYRSAIRVFWWSIVWGVVGLALLIVLIGWFVWAIAGFWFIYRCVLGLVRASESRLI